VNDRRQVQEFDKPLLSGEAACGSEQLGDYEARWNVCPRRLRSTTIIPGHQNVTATGLFPHHQPPCNVWAGGFESSWKNHVSAVALPWQTDGIMPPAKLLCEPVFSADQQHFVKHIKVRMATFMNFYTMFCMLKDAFSYLNKNCPKVLYTHKSYQQQQQQRPFNGL